MNKNKLKIIAGVVAGIIIAVILVIAFIPDNNTPMTEDEKLKAAWTNIYNSQFSENDIKLVSDEIEDYIQDKYVGKKDNKITMANKDEYISINTKNSADADEFYNNVFKEIKNIYKGNAKNWNIVVNSTGDGTSVMYILYTTK